MFELLLRTMTLGIRLEAYPHFTNNVSVGKVLKRVRNGKD